MGWDGVCDERRKSKLRHFSRLAPYPAQCLTVLRQSYDVVLIWDSVILRPTLGLNEV